MHPYESRITRAHRRFLGLAAPDWPFQTEPLAQVMLFPWHLEFFQARLLAAGAAQGGIVIATRILDTLEVAKVLPGGAPPRGDPFALRGDYVLAALEASRQGAEFDLDWLGHWVMAADGRLPDVPAQRRLWTKARAQALVSPDHPLLFVGVQGDTLVVEAQAEHAGGPRPLTVGWHLDEPPGDTLCAPAPPRASRRKTKGEPV